MTIPSKRRCPPTSAAAAPKKKNTNKPSAAPVRPPPSAAQRSSPIDGDEEDEEEEDQLSQDADEEDLVDKTGSAADSQPQASPRLAEIVRALNGDDALLRSSKHIKELRKRARCIPKFLGPAVEVKDIFHFGPYCINTDDIEDEPDEPLHVEAHLKKIGVAECKRLAQQYEQLFELFPDLESDLKYLTADETRMTNFIDFLNEHADAGRRDDIKSCRRGILLLIPNADNEHNFMILATSDKSVRGWAHIAIARLLCPRSSLDEFDANPVSFCCDVVEGRRLLLAGDYMAFLYHSEEFRKDDVEYGLFRGPLLLSVLRHLFTGPSSALSNVPGPSSVGQPPVAVQLDIKQVTPEMIAWAAVMCYFAFCSRNSWHLQDGGVNLLSLWDAVLAAFNDRDSIWAVETLQWYNLHVFGPQSVHLSVQHNQQPVHETMAETMARQRAERKATRGNSA
ncbi:hypothetical protein BC629DRAFT_1599723 [Irpex lacteus]|nr:hypothetical protein BC629DRAFT_1599723 [Irpex lacteus]